MGDESALSTVMRARPDILNHNIETVPSLYPQVRPKGRYPRSLELLQRAKRMDASVYTKSGIMLGLGEEIDEVIQVFRDLRAHDVEILTVGQYLRPTPNHLPIARYVTPDEFAMLKVEALQLGFRHVESGPLVRSSYHAASQVPDRAAAG
jgi:lipoic acid synthetase